MRKKIGILGGSFDPPHKGHRWAIEACLKHTDLIYVIPSHQTPGKALSQTPTIARLQIIKETVKDLPQVQVLDIEIERGGVSYTIDTLNQLSLEKDDLYLIMGEETLFHLHTWKKIEQIIHKVNLIILSLTDFKKKKNWPIVFQKHLKKTDKNKGQLKTGKEVIFIKIEKFQNISSTQIRNKLKLGLSISEMLYPSAVPLVQKHYKYLQKNLKIFDDMIGFLKDKGALNPEIFQFKEKIYEYILVASGLNTRHVRFLSIDVQNHIQKMYGISPQYIEGKNLFQWVVLDYNFLIIHIFYDYLRQYYQLEDLWKKRSNGITKV